MNNVTPINVDGLPGLMGRAGQRLHAMRERAGKAVCLLDARMRTLTVEPEEGAATRICGGFGCRHRIRRRFGGHHEIRCHQNAADQHHQESAERRVIHAEAMVETPYR